MGQKRSISEFMKKLHQISLWKFVKYNYFTPNIHRSKKAYIIPFKNSILEMDKTAKINLNGTIHFGINKLRGSKAETYIRLAGNSKWDVKGDVLLFYNVFIDIKENALFETEFFSANSGTVMIAGKHITLGHDVMLGRNVIIYDSDFHMVLGEDEKPVNFAQEVRIGSHVWLTNNITVLKGVTIHDGALVSAMTLIRKDIPEAALVAGIPGKIIRENIKWSREHISET